MAVCILKHRLKQRMYHHKVAPCVWSAWPWTQRGARARRAGTRCASPRSTAPTAAPAFSPNRSSSTTRKRNTEPLFTSAPNVNTPLPIRTFSRLICVNTNQKTCSDVVSVAS
ncbi:uncharacterized protein LOC125231249 [Leguminivora glycinivorella]|uniref:uncharacterized protein LOC125231249 n=1 Tax=Leguminivora glycinivorella TaxID=1035111 RepID=UPI0020104CA3|nr:uncharacterized protein LOC125231249 [Leguminivora glycinivorella]